jgi:hypothetical protein
MKIINLTPHPIVLYKNGQAIETIPSSGFVRANQKNELIGNLNGWPLSKIEFGECEDMPEPQPGTAYVVSQITANALKAQGRTDDVYIVDGAVRDESGRIIGCEGFAQV